MSSPQPSPRRKLAPFLAIACVLICFAVAICYWDWLTEEGKELRSIVIRNSVLVAAAIAAFILTIWRSIVAEERLELAQRSHLQERFQNAAGMLGGELLSVRLGGIHALDQLARNYPNEFHIQVMQLFAAFVRHPLDYDDQQASDGSEGGTRVPPCPREDMQVIVVSLGARTLEGRKLECAKGFVIDLRGADLREVWFPADACLERVRLSGARLSGVIGLTQGQLDAARADPSNPPDLRGALDCKTKKPLIWSRTPIPRG